MSNPNTAVTLCLIAKNEKHNLPALFESVKDCFEEIHVTDTGSTDGTVELLQEWVDSPEKNPAGLKTKLVIKHFEWVYDFSKARNFSIEDVVTPYWAWLDCDDSLSDPGAFITWKNQVMPISEYWMATYQYSTNEQGQATCSFARERVMKTECGFKFEYFLHEGCKPFKKDGTIGSTNYVPAWRVIHRRTQKDIERDTGRNLGIFERNKDTVDSRMKFYWGKELFEQKKPLEAYEILAQAITAPDLELHDRILGVQYITFCCQQLLQWPKSLDFAFQGLQLSPNRAEFHIAVADAFVKMNRLVDAIPFYEAAKNCRASMPGAAFQGPLFSMEDVYTVYPRNCLARVYFSIGEMDKAVQNAEESVKMKLTTEAKGILNELLTVKERMSFEGARPTNEIVITGHPTGPFEWDEELFKKNGCGGSETAAIQMAYWLKTLTGRPVKIFNNRKTRFVAQSGVEYLPAELIPDYFKTSKPALHLAWRHNNKVTDARTAVWAHDLFTPGSDQAKNYDEFLCLSPFHADLSQTMGQVPKEKIWQTRNGILAERYQELPKVAKNPNKFVYVSSPDRGLVNLIPVLDLVRNVIPELELHVFYGIEKLPLYGDQMKALHDQLKAMIEERPWIKYHGFTEQKKMIEMCSDAAMWVHPANFIETSMISAMEMVALGIYPVTRRLGAIPDTLKEAIDKNMATILEHDAVTEDERLEWANAICHAHKEKAWERMAIDVQKYSWESVAKEWIKHFDL